VQKHRPAATLRTSEFVAKNQSNVPAPTESRNKTPDEAKTVQPNVFDNMESAEAAFFATEAANRKNVQPHNEKLRADHTEPVQIDDVGLDKKRPIAHSKEVATEKVPHAHRNQFDKDGKRPSRTKGLLPMS
jgi:predicted outer membrane protein